MTPRTIFKKPLTAERLRALLHYDPEIGIFTWLSDRGGRKAGQPSGTIRVDGYVQICIDRELYLAHMLAWFYVHGEWSTKQIDHHDTVRSHNWLSNLRPTIQSLNNANGRLARNNTSGLKGAYWCAKTKRWTSRIGVNGKSLYLGKFETREAAHAAYCVAARKYFGEFARVA